MSESWAPCRSTTVSPVTHRVPCLAFPAQGEADHRPGRWGDQRGPWRQGVAVIWMVSRPRRLELGGRPWLEARALPAGRRRWW